jgi:lipoprotein-anchoring transpeptidase ErfK/SrfK
MRIERRPRGLGRAGLALALTLVACSSADAGGGAAKNQAASATTATTGTTLPPSTSTSTSTTEAPTTTTTAAPVAAANASIPSVRALQERLAELGYDVGTPDGKWGARTTYSLMAFQKVEGLSRDGQDGPQTQAALATASKPGAMVPGGAANRIEIDVERQVLFHWVNGSLARILPVSTGNDEHYCVDGECSVAVTPGGNFRIGRKAAGLEVAPLGELWWPMYFNGGIAIHGSPSVPAYPASHGCIRIPMTSAEWFPAAVHIGMPVHVVGVDGQPPTPGASTTTTVAPVTAAPVITPPTTPTTLNLLDSLLRPPAP